MYGLTSTANKRASEEKMPLSAELAQISEYKSHLADGFSSVGGGQADGDEYENGGAGATLNPKSQIRALPFRRQSAN